ncbi:GNAT family N-acetyltransferase [Myxococcus sp. CA040A]|uniref:GNAT family N-acetyltransferase n=1 Tax=Myxococcus sp. CA040A TaxID=2741738 RepID=UPI0020C70788|nr:GNAT family N-acetyltransferase [Myxococcus sp. CA040A]
MMHTMLHGFESTTTERLLLRPFRETDLDAVFTLHGDPETSRFNPSGPLRSLDAAKELLALWLSDWAKHGVGYWAVEQRETPGVVVGVCGVRHKLFEGRTVLNLAYRFAPRTQGLGYATEAARVAVEKARRHLPDVPLVAIIHPENAPSLRVAERLGLRFERITDYEGTPSRVYGVD